MVFSLGRVRGVLGVLMCAAGISAAADVVDSGDAKAAASTFLSRGMASAALPGRTVSSVERRGRLWVARLQPYGYVVLSGSDLCTPIVAFSDKDFEEPEQDSAFAVLLSGADESCSRAEGSGSDAGESEANKAQWRGLLSGATSVRSRLLSASPSDGSVVVKPFLTTRWQQWQPYNDFAPVVHQNVSASSGYRTYRGRSQAGCVATATAQIFNWFQWPARIDKTRTVSHVVGAGDSTPKTPFTIRFDGHEPLSYENLLQAYTSQLAGGETDLRGTLAESVRFPMARLMLFCDSLANMTFGGSGIGGTQGSSSYFPDVMDNTAEWYQKGTSIYVYDQSLLQTAISRTKQCIQSGIPVCVTIPGHQVVGHGWAEENGTTYLYVNYGFGGSKDGYYAMKSDTASTIQYVFVDYKPRKMVQIDPLPVVCGGDVSLSWHFPNLYTNGVVSFSVNAATSSSTVETFTDTFPSPEASELFGQFDNAQGVWVYSLNEKDDSGGYLIKAYAGAKGTYTWTNATWSVRTNSRIQFDLTSSNAAGQKLEVQANVNGAGWQTIATPILETGAEKTNRVDIDLSQYAGALVDFRLAFSGTLDWSISDPVIMIDDVMFVNVARAHSTTEMAGASARTHSFTDLSCGDYTFTVTPVFAKESGVGATVSTRVASSAPALPQILSVSSDEPAFVDGFYRECAIGKNYFTVTCSENVSRLEAFASHTDYLPDSSVSVVRAGVGRFAVMFDASAIPSAADRTRMIMTLKATDEYGTSAYKDISLRFSSKTSTPDHEVRIDGVPLSYNWIWERFPSISSDEEARGVYAQKAQNGFAYWENYALGIEPTNTTAKLLCGSIVIDSNGNVTVSGDTSAFALRDGLEMSLTLQQASSPTADDGDWKDVGGFTDYPGDGVPFRFYRLKATIRSE